MKRIFLSVGASAITLAGCTHQVAVDRIDIEKKITRPGAATIYERKSVAAETCEAQYEIEKQNFLSAAQTVIARNNLAPNPMNPPLDRFRAEINAAYDAVVMRCKTHMHCLEVHQYDEARCYMAASDRKDAERLFSDLSERLREIDEIYGRKHSHHKKKKKGKGRPVQVTVETTVSQTNKQKTHVGDKVEDQDVLIACGDVNVLLEKRCRDRCDDKKRC